MKKLGFLAAAASLLWMTIHPSIPALAAQQNTFQPKSGGYTITIPPGSEEVYHTSTGIRFKVGQDFMVSADLYALPSFISVPMKQYSSEQKKELDRFLAKIQDDPDCTIETVGASQNVGGTALDRLRQRAEGKTQQQTKTAEKPKRVINDKTYEFLVKPKDPTKTNRPYILGKAFQPQTHTLLVVMVRTTDANADAASQALNAMTQNLKLSRVRFPDINLLTVPNEHYSIEIPNGWRVFTVRADNVIFAKSLSSVHTDNLMIRGFSDDSFKELGSASKETIAQAENNFINKITQYTPNITIIKHEPITVGDLRGSLFESTDNEDLKKAFILNAYLLNPQGKGYMLHFQTDDTINYDLKLKAFRQAVESFTLLKGEEENTTAAD
jgi:hypothetical protein